MIKDKPQTIKVIARFRPLISLELELGEAQINWFSMPNESTISVIKDSTPENFSFDKVFSINSDQVEIFECLGRPIVEDVLSGYNGTVFAYGQTGSGKTFTMMGADIFDPTSRGVIPRAVSLIFDSLSNQPKEIESTIKCSMLEIYKENLQDLLVRGPKLKIKESKTKGIYVDGISEIYVVCEEEILNAIAIGEKNRSIACTKMNQQSSRSHQIFMIEVGQRLPDGSFKRGVLNLVDLAGSEKVNQTGATGEKLEEAKKINLSLSALGNVIKALTSGAEHIPYRDSKLTRLLQESLGGNYKTSLVVNCSPHPRNIEDSVNTLKFAQRAKTIKNSAKANITLSVEAYIKTINELKIQLQASQLEVAKLQKVIKEHGGLVRSSTFMSEPLSPVMKVVNSSVVDELNGQILELKGQLSGLRERVNELESEREEFSEQVKDLENKLSQERVKKLQAEEKLMGVTQQLEILQIQASEKQGNEERLMSENKKLEAKISMLTQVLREFSVKFTEQLSRLSKNEGLSLQDYFFETVQSLEESLENCPKSFMKYFPESIRLEAFLSSYQSGSSELPLRKRLLLTEIANCELSSMHWTLYCKYTILQQQYANLFSKFDLQKKILSSFKRLVKEMQEMYTEMFSKVYKYAMSVAANTASRIRRPVNNVLPEVFEQKTGANKEFLRRASLFHMVSNGFGSSTMLDPKEESLLIKNIENKLEIQALMNNQLKITARSVKDEHQQLASKMDSLQLDQAKFEEILHSRLEIALQELSNFTPHKPSLSLSITPHQATAINRTNSLKFAEEPGSPNIIRSREKHLTLTSNDIMSKMKSSLSQNFIKAQGTPLLKKEGDLSPIFSERKTFG